MDIKHKEILENTAKHLIRLAGYYTTAKYDELKTEYDCDYIQLSKFDQKLIDKAFELAKSITEWLNEK